MPTWWRRRSRRSSAVSRPDWWDLDPPTVAGAGTRFGGRALGGPRRAQAQAARTVEGACETPHELDMNALTIGFGRRLLRTSARTCCCETGRACRSCCATRNGPFRSCLPESRSGGSARKDIVAGSSALAREEPRVAFLRTTTSRWRGISCRRRRVAEQSAPIFGSEWHSGMKAGATEGSTSASWTAGGTRPTAPSSVGRSVRCDAGPPQIDDVAEAEGLFRLLEREWCPRFTTG